MPGYGEAIVQSNPLMIDPLEGGIFSFNIETHMGPTPDEPIIEEEALREYARGRDGPSLAVMGDDSVFVGLRYLDENEQEQWQVARFELDSDPFFHVMDRDYREEVEGLHVGETIYFRVIDKSRNVSPEKDTVKIDVAVGDGSVREAVLMETLGHSGVFKGLLRTQYVDETAEDEDDPLILPVGYGDAVTLTYRPADESPVSRELEIFKGDDGSVQSFTKRFENPEIAVQTQFTIAECYFELAKWHRELDEESRARRQIAQGKKLLEEAIRDYPETEARVQADFLLAELAFEYGKDAKNERIKEEQFLESVNRFSDIVAQYPDDEYAPRAQYKKAIVLGEMGQTNEARREFVKLAARYPEHELVADTIARLGKYFADQAKSLAAEAEEQTDPVKRDELRLDARQQFIIAGQVYVRLWEQFPTHELRFGTTALAGQAYLLGEDYESSVEAFEKVYESEQAPNEIRAESLYWAGRAYLNANNMTMAYRTFTRVRWDFPDSRWAKLARGMLQTKAMISAAQADVTK
jgi:TolA-binding protein